MKKSVASITILIVTLVAGLLVPTAAIAQDDDVPTIALLSYNNIGSLRSRTTEGVYDTLAYHGYLEPEEAASLAANEDFSGENINIMWRDAGADLPTINIMVEQALDRGADIIVTTTTNVTRTAVKATLESGIEPPPLVIFALVTAPYSAGIAEAPCLKPANVVGSHALASYEKIVELLPVQDPEVDKIGTFVNASRFAHVYAAEQIELYASELGIEVERAIWTDAADGMLAGETLLDKEVDMIVALGFPPSLPAIVDAANVVGTPIVSASISHIPRGVHIAGGFYAYYEEGLVIGNMLTAALQGELDPARTGIHAAPRLTVALNRDSIAEADIEISNALEERVDFVIENGESTEEFVKPEWPDVDMDERRANRAAFLEALHCSDEMIEEQRAALAADE